MRILSLLSISFLCYPLYGMDDLKGELIRSSHKSEQGCVRGNFGNKACGYNCLRSINRVACAKSPDQRCLADKFGRISCGRDCQLDRFIELSASANLF